MPNSDYSFIRDLREEFVWNLYRSMRSSGGYPSLYSICVAIEQLPVPIHFISYRMGRLTFTRYFQEHTYKPHKNKLHRMLYQSFLTSCRDYIGQHADATPTQVVQYAIATPSPVIGLTSSQIYRILTARGAR